MKKIFVIAKSKIITVDTISPILQVIKSHCNIDSEIYIPDISSYNEIKKNIILNDIIATFGKLKIFGGDYTIFFIRKIIVLLQLIKILLSSIFFNSKVIHFGFFDRKWYLRVVGSLIKNNLIYSLNTVHNVDYQEIDLILNGHMQQKKIHVMGNSILTFTDKQVLSLNLKKNQSVFMVGYLRMTKGWMNQTWDKAYMYIKKLHNININKERYCVVILGSYEDGQLYINEPSYKVTRSLACSMLKVINLVDPGLNILLKPHKFTDMKFINSLVSSYDNCQITYLHPTVLLNRCSFFIANNNTTLFSDAKKYGVPTIEYTDYKDVVLSLTKGRSTGWNDTDYFIQNDPERLEEAIYNILNRYEKTHIKSNELSSQLYDFLKVIC